jgi:hypothetical protein
LTEHGNMNARRSVPLLLSAVLAVIATIAVLLDTSVAKAQSALSADPGIKPDAPLDPNRPLAQELVTSTAGNLSLVAVGSLTVSSPNGPLPAFDPAILSLLTGSDLPNLSTVTIGDLETSIFDVKTFKGYP